MLEPTDFEGKNAVDSYGPGFFRIAGKVFQGGIVVEGDRIQPWQGLDDLDPLRALEGRVDVLFLGLGDRIGYAPRPLTALLEGLGIRVEAMP